MQLQNRGLSCINVYENRLSQPLHCDLKISMHKAIIDENFANYFLKPKANNKCFMLLKWTCKGLQKSIRAVKSKPNGVAMKLFISRPNLCAVKIWGYNLCSPPQVSPIKIRGSPMSRWCLQQYSNDDDFIPGSNKRD